MLKLSKDSIQMGLRFVLRESWHEKLINFTKIQALPYEYILEGFTQNANETYYIFQSEGTVKGKKIRIAAQKFIVRYFEAQEVPDSNIGFSFKEYLPLENTQILITNERNPNEVIPAVLKVEPQLVQIDGTTIMPALALQIFYMNGTGFSDVKHYSVWHTLPK